MTDQRRSYRVYGLRLTSVLPLPCPNARSRGRPDVEVVTGRASVFSRVHRAIAGPPNHSSWFRHAPLADGSHYLRWSGLFEFLILADGRRILCRPLGGASGLEAFQTYLLTQVLSFAMLKHGLEPLHSTAVVIDGGAVAFVGDCGYGKSSLGAAFLQAGCPLLTDDLLVLKEERRGFVGHPGPPRIKLFPEIAARLLGEWTTGTPMNTLTPKLVIPLPDDKICWRGAPPLKAIFVLEPPSTRPRSDGITIRSLSPRRAFLEILKNTFNLMVVEPARLERQFDLAWRLARRVPVKSLSYPRALERLPAVREAIQSHLAA